jgi:hypothetical protein
MLRELDFQPSEFYQDLLRFMSKDLDSTSSFLLSDRKVKIELKSAIGSFRFVLFIPSIRWHLICYVLCGGFFHPGGRGPRLLAGGRGLCPCGSMVLKKIDKILINIIFLR